MSIEHVLQANSFNAIKHIQRLLECPGHPLGNLRLQLTGICYLASAGNLTIFNFSELLLLAVYSQQLFNNDFSHYFI